MATEINSHTLPRAMMQNALIDYNTPVLDRSWNREIGPEQPEQAARSDAMRDPTPRQIDFSVDGMLPASHLDYELGNRADLYV